MLTEPADVQEEKEEEDRVPARSAVPPQRWRHDRNQGTGEEIQSNACSLTGCDLLELVFCNVKSIPSDQLGNIGADFEQELSDTERLAPLSEETTSCSQFQCVVCIPV